MQRARASGRRAQILFLGGRTMEHVIIGKAFRYQVKDQKDNLEKYRFNNEKGFWENKETGVPLVRSVDGPKPTTKKADVETGEDRKST
jgi:hypothetical protein